MQKSVQKFFLWVFEQNPCWNFWILSPGVQVHSSGWTVTVPQRCECSRVSQAQYFTLLVQNYFNSSSHHLPPTIKKLLDPQKGLVQSCLQKPIKTQKPCHKHPDRRPWSISNKEQNSYLFFPSNRSWPNLSNARNLTWALLFLRDNRHKKWASSYPLSSKHI